MPLPQPTYPQYRPQSFLEKGGGGALTKALELYAKYHPAAMQQRLYGVLLEDEQFLAKDRATQRKLLAEERQELVSTLSRFRETGLGPSGAVGGRSGSFGARSSGARGMSDSVIQKHAEAQGEKLVASKKQSVQDRNLIFNEYRPSNVHQTLIQNIQRNRLYQSNQVLTPDQLQGIIATESAKMGNTLAGSEQSYYQAAAAATDLWTDITSRFPGLVTTSINPDGTTVLKATEAGYALARMIDSEFQSKGQNINFLVQSLEASQSPALRIDKQRNFELQNIGASPGKSFAELEMDRLMRAASADGKIDEDEQQKLDQYRKLHGLAAPLDEEEQAFLVRYMEALRNDGIATREELGADYDSARAAYEKARNLERLPRGMAAFYDESYLRGLQRMSQIDKEMADLTVPGSPMQRAAQRAAAGTGLPGPLPKVPLEAIQAASQVHPLAGEVLPYAMQRVQNAAGAVTPQDAVERFADQYINMEPARDFSAYVNAVTKRYPNEPLKRRKALAYYGAKNYQKDTEQNTLSRGALTANADEAADEARVLFMNAVDTSTPATIPTIPVTVPETPVSTGVVDPTYPRVDAVLPGGVNYR